MADEITLSEPAGSLRFQSLRKLWEHVLKHVCSPDEKWRILDGFDAETIREAQNRGIDDIPDMQSPLYDLAMQYQALISKILTQACAEQQNHIHVHEEYTPESMVLYQVHDSEPSQAIIALGTSQKIVVIARKDVTNEPSQGYILKTAYRINIKTKKSWLKQERSRLLEMDDMRHGKKVTLLANHLGSNNEEEKDGSR